MRFLLPLLLIALPLAAQDTDEAEKKRATTKYTKAQITKWLNTFQSADKVKRKEAAEALQKLDEKSLRILIQVVREQAGIGFVDTDRFKTVLTPITTLTLVADSPGEVIKGSWSEDGKQIDYTIKSLGKGRYKLEAGVKGKAERTIKDEGTMTELKGRHDFLKAVSVLVTPQWREVTKVRDNAWRDLTILSGPRLVAKPQPLTGLGITVRKPSEELAYHLYLPQGVGLVVEKVKPGSKAAKLGLKEFDVLTKIGGEHLESFKQLEKPKGTLEIVRRGKRIEIEIGR